MIDIECPYCHYHYEMDTIHGMRIQFGENTPRANSETDCPECDRTFFIDVTWQPTVQSWGWADDHEQ